MQKMLNQVVSVIEKETVQIAKEPPVVLLAIDGKSGSGKSSFAALLVQKYACPVIHADDFFLQDHQRTPERLAEIGGNIDYERLLAVVEKAASGKSFAYTPYNCKTGSFDNAAEIPQNKLIIVEGVYSLHPHISHLYALKLFLEIDDKTQQQRILKRSGKQLAQRFAEEWIPMENRYFKYFKIKESCDLAFGTSTAR